MKIQSVHFFFRDGRPHYFSVGQSSNGTGGRVKEIIKKNNSITILFSNGKTETYSYIPYKLVEIPDENK